MPAVLDHLADHLTKLIDDKATEAEIEASALQLRVIARALLDGFAVPKARLFLLAARAVA